MPPQYRVHLRVFLRVFLTGVDQYLEKHGQFDVM